MQAVQWLQLTTNAAIEHDVFDDEDNDNNDTVLHSIRHDGFNICGGVVDGEPYPTRLTSSHLASPNLTSPQLASEWLYVDLFQFHGL